MKYTTAQMIAQTKIVIKPGIGKTCFPRLQESSSRQVSIHCVPVRVKSGRQVVQRVPVQESQPFGHSTHEIPKASYC